MPIQLTLYKIPSLLVRASSRAQCLPKLPPVTLRTFTTSPIHHGPPPHPPRQPIPSAELTISYLKGSGPGGQKINKTNSAVQIKHLPTGIVIKCQETRSRDQNEKIAVRKLQDRLEEMEKGEESRLAKRRELLRKRKRNREKKARRKYRALEEEGRRETKRDVEVRGGDAESENIGVDGAQPTDAEGAAENSQHDQDRVSRPGTNPGDNG